MANTAPANKARWERHHANPSEWFWQRVEKCGQEECWPWKGRIMSTRAGYGRLTFNGRMIGAHRMALALSSGKNHPDKFACHRCDNPICCNPKHLFWGTHRDNMADCSAKGRRRGAPSKINLDQLQRLRDEGKSYSALAQVFGVNQASVGKALKRAALRARAARATEAKP
jgi:hypothetical protein